MKFFKLFALFSTLMLSFNTFGKTLSVLEVPFNLMAKKSSGWKNSKGGRSWKDSDVEGFHQFIEKIVSTKNGEYILKKWGIPADCFDLIVALQFIYAYENDLVVSFGGNLNSINFAKNPRQLLNKALHVRGTGSPNVMTYIAKVDHNDPTGLLIHNFGTPGHLAMLLKYNGIVYKVESPFPANYSAVSKKFYIDDKLPGGGTFRRLYFYKRNGANIRKVIPTNYPKVSQNGYEAKKAPVWSNFYSDSNEFSTTAGKAKVLCGVIAERISRVNKGANNCARSFDNLGPECAANSSADYSTPGFDKKVGNIITSFHRSLQQDDTKQRYVCEPMNFHANLSGSDALFIEYELSDIDGYLNNTLNAIIYNERSHDPNEPIEYRWGCRDQSEGLHCLGKEKLPLNHQEKVKLGQALEVMTSNDSAFFVFKENLKLNTPSFLRITGENYYKLIEIKSDQIQVTFARHDIYEVSILDENLNEVSSSALYGLGPY